MATNRYDTVTEVPSRSISSRTYVLLNYSPTPRVRRRRLQQLFKRTKKPARISPDRAARIVCGATKLCNIEKLYQELKWETLENRRNKHKLILLYKMKNNKTPPYLSDLIPQQTQARYALRNASDIPLIPCRTQLYTNSFLPSTIREWNRLEETIRNAPSLLSFKARIKKNSPKSSPLCKVGSRKAQILHARLRLSCSSLNYDLHRRSIVDTPNCMCGAVETVSHFLLYCNQYQHQRQLYLDNLPCPPIVDNLLYGKRATNI